MPRPARTIAAVFTGGSLSAIVLLHLVHVAAVVAGPTALQFVCRIGQ